MKTVKSKVAKLFVGRYQSQSDVIHRQRRQKLDALLLALKISASIHGRFSIAKGQYRVVEHGE